MIAKINQQPTKIFVEIINFDVVFNRVIDSRNGLSQRRPDVRVKENTRQQKPQHTDLVFKIIKNIKNKK